MTKPRTASLQMMWHQLDKPRTRGSLNLPLLATEAELQPRTNARATFRPPRVGLVYQAHSTRQLAYRPDGWRAEDGKGFPPVPPPAQDVSADGGRARAAEDEDSLHKRQPFCSHSQEGRLSRQSC